MHTGHYDPASRVCWRTNSERTKANRTAQCSVFFSHFSLVFCMRARRGRPATRCGVWVSAVAQRPERKHRRVLRTSGTTQFRALHDEQPSAGRAHMTTPHGLHRTIMLPIPATVTCACTQQPPSTCDPRPRTGPAHETAHMPDTVSYTHLTLPTICSV